MSHLAPTSDLLLTTLEIGLCLLEFAATHSATSVELARVEVVLGSELIGDGHGRRRKDVDLLLYLLLRRLIEGSRLLLCIRSISELAGFIFGKLSLLPFFEGFAIGNYLLHAPGYIIELEVCASDWTRVFLVRVILSVNAFVVCEVDVFNLVVCHC